MLNIKHGFGAIGVIIAILVIGGVGGYLWSQKSSNPPANSSKDNSFTTEPAPSPVFSGCDKNIVSYNRKDGTSIPQLVTLRGKDYEINSHIEAEDNWASFTVDGEIGPIGRYYNPLAPQAGNPLMVKGGYFTDSSGEKLSVPDKIVIKGISIMLTRVGYADNRQEFAEVCLNK